MNWLIAPAPGRGVSATLLVFRLAVGVAFVLHGLPKTQNPTGWMNAAGMANAPPGFLQAAAAFIEVGGGALLALGLFTRVATLALAGVMIGALALVHIPNGDPFVAVGRPSMELAVAYLASALLVTATGPGAWSLDAVLFGRPAEAVEPAPRFADPLPLTSP
jgi:putative oxidoreductase